MELHGHKSVGVMDGGYDAWTAAKLPTETMPTTRPAVQFPVPASLAHVASKTRVLDATHDPGVMIIDGRSNEEFRGAKSDAARAGHIPSAVNFFADDNLVKPSGDVNYCRFKKPDDLLETYFGIAPDRKLIVYCNSGRRASVNYLALRMLGRDVSLYQGSWPEWANDLSLPVEASVVPTTAPATRPALSDAK
jgi:thiosulfate/3-mercaptopyruvate sulfurtransferase